MLIICSFFSNWKKAIGTETAISWSLLTRCRNWSLAREGTFQRESTSASLFNTPGNWTARISNSWVAAKKQTSRRQELIKAFRHRPEFNAVSPEFNAVTATSLSHRTVKRRPRQRWPHNLSATTMVKSSKDAGLRWTLETPHENKNAHKGLHNRVNKRRL